MNRNEPDWNLFRTFLYVLKEGSLSGAARALKLTQPTIGRHIDALEASLGTKLFIRSLDGMFPTDTALRLADSVQAMELLSRAMLRKASSGKDAGTVRITASEMIGAEVLPPIIARLQDDHPAIMIELVLSNRIEDMTHGAADIAVRMAKPEQPDLVAKRIGAIRLGAFAHTEYLRRRGTPRSVDDLSNHVLIGFDRNQQLIQIASRWGLDVSRENFAFRSDSEHAQLSALRSGVGIGICQAGIARKDPNLKQVLVEELSFSLDMWLAVHRDQRSARLVKTVYSRLVQELGEYARS